MAPSSPKLTAAAAGGLGVLTVQGLTAPLALAGVARLSDSTPRWFAGLHVALDIATMISAVLVFWGIQAKRPRARMAPVIVLLPFWLALAAAGPFVYQGLAVVPFTGFALAMGAMTSLPFLTRGAASLFEPRAAAPTSRPQSTASK